MRLNAKKCFQVFGSKSQDNSEDFGMVAQLPKCQHSFHQKCILTWLERTSNCPLCRSDLPTDDENYEAYKRHKKREKVREQEISDLHDSMFS